MLHRWNTKTFVRVFSQVKMLQILLDILNQPKLQYPAEICRSSAWNCSMYDYWSNNFGLVLKIILLQFLNRQIIRSRTWGAKAFDSEERNPDSLHLWSHSRSRSTQAATMLERSGKPDRQQEGTLRSQWFLAKQK